MLAYLTKARRWLQGVALGAIIYLTRVTLVRRIASLVEPYLLKIVLDKSMTPGSAGAAIGYLFRSHDPGASAKDIYRDVFSTERLSRGYQSQMGQDMFLNRWFFKDRGPGFFVDVGAFDGVVGSNTSYFE